MRSLASLAPEFVFFRNPPRCFGEEMVRGFANAVMRSCFLRGATHKNGTGREFKRQV